MPTSILDPNEPVPAVRERVDRIRKEVHRVREAPPKPIEIPPPIATETYFDARYPGCRERRAAQREASRREVHPEPVPYDDEWKSLIAQYKARFRRYFWKFFSTVFPREVAILRRAETGLRAELAAIGNPKLSAEQVAEGFSICLAAAKAQDGYDDDRAHLAARFRQLRLNSKIRKQVLDDLPSWFRATPITPADRKRDVKGRFV